MKGDQQSQNKKLQPNEILSETYYHSHVESNNNKLKKGTMIMTSTGELYDHVRNWDQSRIKSLIPITIQKRIGKRHQHELHLNNQSLCNEL